MFLDRLSSLLCAVFSNNPSFCLSLPLTAVETRNAPYRRPLDDLYTTVIGLSAGRVRYRGVSEVLSLVTLVDRHGVYIRVQTTQPPLWAKPFSGFWWTGRGYVVCKLVISYHSVNSPPTILLVFQKISNVLLERRETSALRGSGVDLPRLYQHISGRRHSSFRREGGPPFRRLQVNRRPFTTQVTPTLNIFCPTFFFNSYYYTT